MRHEAAQKRVDQFLDLAVAWCLPIAPAIRDEPAAYRAACIRQGAEAALRARLTGEFVEKAKDTYEEPNS